MNDPSPRVLALRLALACTYADNNAAENAVLAEIGFGRGPLTQVVLELASLVDELAGAEQITTTLAAELDAAQL
jgi:hypothetical protein